MASDVPFESELDQRKADIVSEVDVDQRDYIRLFPKYQRVPTQQAVWNQDGRLHYAVDEYEGPRGVGYQIRFYYELDGARFVSRQNVSGPESWRSFDWRQRR